MRWSSYMPSQQSPAYRRTLRIGLILIAVRLGVFGMMAILSFFRMISDDLGVLLYMTLFPDLLMVEMYIRRPAGALGVIILILTSFLAAWLRVVFVPAHNAAEKSLPVEFPR